MKKSNSLYVCAVFATVLFFSSCDFKKGSDTKGTAPIDSISVGKIQPIDSISVGKVNAIDSISVAPTN
jgi:hypothetical protein